MKKFLISLLAITILFTGSVHAEEDLPKVTDHEKVKIHLFYGYYCGFCHKFLNYFNDLGSKYDDYFEVVAYEVGKNKDNNNLMSKLKERFEAQDGIPFAIIGDEYNVVGFNDDIGEDLIEKALDEYKNKKYKDVVTPLTNEEGITKETIKEAMVTSELVDEDGNPTGSETGTASTTSRAKSESKVSDGVIIGVIFGVVILGIGGLVFLARKEEK